MARRICSRTGKQRFPTQMEADLAVASIHSTNAHHRHRKYRDEPQRSYRCEFCGDWHFTSQGRSENRDSA
jgi:hypothetical protein